MVFCSRNIGFIKWWGLVEVVVEVRLILLVFYIFDKFYVFCECGLGYKGDGGILIEIDFFVCVCYCVGWIFLRMMFGIVMWNL